MRWNIDDVPIFLAVVDRRGITAAARALAMPKSTVSTAISRLEHGLGLRLLDRNSRNLRVTSEGETFYRQAQLIMEQVHETSARMAGLTAVPSGRLSAALPPAFCQEIVAPELPRFHAEYPDIALDIVVTPQGIPLLRDQVDLAVAVGPQDDSELISRTLLAGPLIWVASPAYLAAQRIGTGAQAGADLRAEELRPHIQICEKRYGHDAMRIHVGGHAARLDLSHGITHVNDPLTVRRAVLNGAGITALPRHYCREQIAAGTLVELADHIRFDTSAATLTAVYPHRRLLSPRIRAFLEFLTAICRGKAGG